jgi:Flp pilus assembly protein TadG
MIGCREIEHAPLRGDRGQTIVEFALVMPFLIFLLLGICQFGLAFHNYLSITDAARVGARKAAVSRVLPTGAPGNPCQAAKDAIQATVSTAQWGQISSRITCNPTSPGPVGSSYKISIGYPVTIGLPPIFGLPAFNRTRTMTTSATERLE